MPRPPKPRINGDRAPTTLEYIRRDLEIPQLLLARVSGVQQSTISEYENGMHMQEEHAIQLHQALCSLGRLGLRPQEDVDRLARLQPSDLPRSWEHVESLLEMRTARDNHNLAHDDVVA